MKSATASIEVRVGHLRSPAVQALLREHLEDMADHSPAESVHALDVSALCDKAVTFWTAWDADSDANSDDDNLMGCVALKMLSDEEGEVKSMRTHEKHLRRGVAHFLLEHVIQEAKVRGMTRLNLETGSGAAFNPARSLYEAAGFDYCGPFSDYREDPYSVFMTLPL